MINIKNLTFTYGGEKNILDDLSVNIEDGIVYSLLGVNGAGKTTLFKCLNGDLPSSIDVTNFSDEMLYIQDEMQFYKYLTGEEFINIILNFKDVKLDNEMYTSLVSKLLMENKIKEIISAYSFGMKSKLILIIAFLLKYKYILMDEPFTSLDVLAADTMVKVIKEYVSGGNTVIISTHMIDIAQEVSDRILFLNNGNIQEYYNDFSNSKDIKEIILNRMK
ncbi:ATP-binding cassette domain-containing protein [Clostridium sp. DL1XJH146]